MDDPKYDDLDKLFQSRLKPDKLDASDWNTPPSFVFDDAMDQIDNERKKKRGFFWFWFGLGAAIIVIISIVAYNFVSIQRINQTLATSTPNIDKITEIEYASSNTNIDTEYQGNMNSESDYLEANFKAELDKKTANIVETNGSSNSSKNKLVKNQKASTLPIIAKNETTVASKQAIKTINNQASSNNLFSNSTSKGNLSTPSTVLNPKESRELSLNINKLLLPTPLLISDQEILPTSIDFYFHEEKKEVHSNQDVRINAFAGVLLSSFSMTNLVDSPFSLTGYEDYQQGITVGLGLEKPITDNLFSTLDLSYNRVNNTSQYIQDMSYIKSNEVVGMDGNMMYQTDYTIESTMGRFAGSLDIPLDNMDFTDGELVENSTAIKQRFDIFSSNIGLGYKLVHKSRFDFSVLGSVGLNYILNLEEDLNTQIFIDDVMMKNKSIINESLTKSNRFYASIFGGFRLQYRTSDRLSLSLNAGLERAITTMRKCATDKEPATYINNRRISIGASYTF